MVTEFIEDDSNDRDLERRLEEARDSGVLGESDLEETEAEAMTTESGFWLRASVARDLFEHQKAAVRWLWALHENGVGGIVGDEMGLGKTAQISAFLGAVADGPRRRPGAAGYRRGCETLRSALVVAPTTMLAHWRRELRRWAPKAKVVVLHRSAQRFNAAAAAGATALAVYLQKALAAPPMTPLETTTRGPSCVVCVTTYDAMHRLQDALLHKRWGYVVLDEGQKIRNPKARVTVLCKRVRTSRRVLLSGTPVQNSLQELWSLFDFACPGRLGTLEAFEAELGTPIRVGGYANARPAQVELAYRSALALRDLIRPYLLRRTKAAVCVGDGSLCALPPKTEHVLLCRLTWEQYDLYQSLVDSALVQQAVRGSTRAFQAIAILRKICNHPDLYTAAASGDGEESYYTKNNPGDVARSSKLATLVTVLRRWRAQGHRALVFSQSKQMLDIIEALVRAAGWPYSRIDGDTPATSRQATADAYNAASSTQFVMLLTTRVGGVGLSLIGADRVVLFDPDWNPQTDAQARERAWRLGQTKPVTIYRMLCAGTIEEKMYHRQIFKQALTNRVLNDPKQRRLFSQSELAELFTLQDSARPLDDRHGLTADDDVATDTAALLGASGVVERPFVEDGDAAARSEDQDDKAVLSALWDGGDGLANVFSHDAIDRSATIADAAEREAQRAVAHLRSTTTTSSSRLVQRRPPSARELLLLGGPPPAPAAGRHRGGPPPLMPGGNNDNDGLDASAFSVRLLRRIDAFLSSRRQPPTTRDLIDHFADVRDAQAPLFKSLLRQVAKCDNGVWKKRR